jgi:hypothetical protein
MFVKNMLSFKYLVISYITLNAIPKYDSVKTIYVEYRFRSISVFPALCDLYIL